MKLNTSQKRLLVMGVLIVFTLSASGCRIPTDETGAIKQITSSTTFGEIMSTESWFSAIFVWPLSQLLNWVTPKIGVGGAVADHHRYVPVRTAFRCNQERNIPRSLPGTDTSGRHEKRTVSLHCHLAGYGFIPVCINDAAAEDGRKESKGRS